jgi:hypothetical protein
MNNDRTYGVEMEIIGNKREVIRSLRRAGIEVNDEDTPTGTQPTGRS